MCALVRLAVFMGSCMKKDFPSTGRVHLQKSARQQKCIPSFIAREARRRVCPTRMAPALIFTLSFILPRPGFTCIFSKYLRGYMSLIFSRKVVLLLLSCISSSSVPSITDELCLPSNFDVTAAYISLLSLIEFRSLNIVITVNLIMEILTYK